jgi:hypothetical protein
MTIAATNPPGLWQLTILQGATWRQDIDWLEDNLPVDLNGWTARMQIRATRGDGVTEKALYDELLIELATSNGAIILNANKVTGRIRLQLTDEQTADLPAAAARYDLELTSAGGEVTRLLMGDMFISEEVTRGG